MKNLQFKGIPIFRIKDYKKAIEFYVEFLGFRVDWEHRFGDSEPVYMQVSNNGLILHLSENERFQTDVIIFIETNGIKNFRTNLLNENNSNLIPEISTTNWNTKQLELEDPFGNVLRFNENRIDE